MGNRPIHLFTLPLALLAASLPVATPVQAEVFNVCEIKETADGFAALRKAPSARSPIISRMKAGHVLVIEKTDVGLVTQGKWLKASYFPGEAMPNPGEPGSENIRHGWVHTGLVGDCG